jgi:NADH dehydrogenase [ubiquinone] 1 alpha subcomplex assembly factor 7
MTNLAEHLKELIRADGPLSVAEYMRICLTARSDSYYRRGEPIGAAGDFVTAPEVSQIFGELIGLWCVDLWRQLGGPKHLALVELGPGRGTLMRDALRAARVAPRFLDAVTIVLVEISEALRRLQADALRDAGAVSLHWRDRFDDIDAAGPMIVIANEFFDALPVRQFMRAGDGWAERCVGLRDGELVLGASPDAIDARLVPTLPHMAEEGAIVEVSPARAAIGRAVGERIAHAGGATLIIDYGFAGPAVGDTLQAVRGHGYAHVLAEPGEADLTSHVDFTALGHALAEGGAKVLPLATQGAFLNRLGAAERVNKLRSAATPAQAKDLEAAYDRLTGDEAMGSLFKVLCAFAPASLQPAGFV